MVIELVTTQISCKFELRKTQTLLISSNSLLDFVDGFPAQLQIWWMDRRFYISSKLVYWLHHMYFPNFSLSTVMQNWSVSIYSSQAFWRTPHKPFRQVHFCSLFMLALLSCTFICWLFLTAASLQRFCMVKPCPKEMKCDVEVCVFFFLSKITKKLFFLAKWKRM